MKKISLEDNDIVWPMALLKLRRAIEAGGHGGMVIEPGPHASAVSRYLGRIGMSVEGGAAGAITITGHRSGE